MKTETLQEQFAAIDAKIKTDGAKPKKFSKYINIGGCPYHRKAVHKGHPVTILSATDSQLSVKSHSVNQEWIEQDNDQLVIYEKGEMIPAYNYPKLP